MILCSEKLSQELIQGTLRDGEKLNLSSDEKPPFPLEILMNVAIGNVQYRGLKLETTPFAVRTNRTTPLIDYSGLFTIANIVNQCQLEIR